MPREPVQRSTTGFPAAAFLPGPISAGQAAKLTSAALAVIAFAFGLWYAQTAILLTFAGILLAIVLGL